MGHNLFYNVERVKTYLFDDSKLVIMLETDMFPYFLEPWKWDLDKTQIGLTLCIDFQTHKNKYTELRFNKMGHRECALGAFSLKQFGFLVPHLEALQKDEELVGTLGRPLAVKFEVWEEIVLARMVDAPNSQKGGNYGAYFYQDHKFNDHFVLVANLLEDGQSRKVMLEFDWKEHNENEVVKKMVFDVGFGSLGKHELAEDVIKQDEELEDEEEEEVVFEDFSRVMWEDNHLVMNSHLMSHNSSLGILQNVKDQIHMAAIRDSAFG
jgi:hypothetical protein